jgi:acetoin utilization deacetylase AcuC-like enzyme
MKRHLPWLIQDGKPDILLYQAGADPLRDDPYSPLQLTHEDLKARDRIVFEFAKAEKIPVAWVLAGGYCPEIEKVVHVHLNTARACWEVFGEN